MERLARIGPARLVLALALGAVLAWRIAASGVAALADAESGADASSAADLRARIAENPLDAQQMLALSRARKSEGADADSISALEQAVALAPANRAILAEGATLLLQMGRESAGLTLLERLVRLYPDAGDSVWPVFTAALSMPRHRDFFVEAARADAAWWPLFFGEACNHAPSDAVQTLFLARVAAGTVTDAERKCAVDRFLRERRWNVAYQLWLDSLPTAGNEHVGYIYNGDFEAPLSQIGFDWRTPGDAGVGVTTEAVDGMGGAHALRVRFIGQRYAGSPAWQYVMLAPGRYALHGSERADDLETWTGVRMALYCTNGVDRPDGRLLAKSPPLAGSVPWRVFRAEFSVGADCPLQVLRVEAIGPQGEAASGGGPLRLRGTAWFDDVRVAAVE